ncbi:MAG: amidohydrolase family protein [Candidatus Poribacteria bacterium]|nr:amidohydrolase family protein [Candidatus Poribacteria bacterium]
MIIDTHLHVWTDEASRYPFAEGRQVNESATVELLNETMAEAGVDKAVIVQPIHYLYDNRYVADCLRRFPGKFAAIGLVNPKAPDAPDQLERLVKEDGFGGLRIHLARRDPPSEWATPDQDAIWQRSEDLGVGFIVYGPAARLPAVEPIIARFPNVNVVLDHIGGAPTDEEPPYPLLSNVLRMSQYPNVYVKFTPQAHKSKLPYPHEDTFPTFRRIYDAFGPQRLMWGTNFPGVLRSTGYLPALELFRTHLDFLNDTDKEWLFSRSAMKVWKFGE